MAMSYPQPPDPHQSDHGRKNYNSIPSPLPLYRGSGFLAPPRRLSASWRRKIKGK